MGKFVGWYFLMGIAPLTVALPVLFIGETFSINFSIDFQWVNVGYLVGALIAGIITRWLYRYVKNSGLPFT
jgi:hypothetical protein